MTASARHELVSEACCAWALRYGFVAVAMNSQMAGGPGDADAVAVGTIKGRRRVAVFESKVSRADFRRDKKKWHRQHGALGSTTELWYAAPAGLIPRGELNGAGLLEVDENGRASVVVRPAVRDITPETFMRQLTYVAKACSQKYLASKNCAWLNNELRLNRDTWAEAAL